MAKQKWSCKNCGESTTDPKNALITYFHADCPKR